MGKIWMLAVANIRKSKSQAVSLLVFVMIAAMFLNIGLVLYIDLNDAFDKRAEELHAPHLAFIINQNVSADGKLSWLEENPLTNEVERQSIVGGYADYTLNGFNTAAFFMLTSADTPPSMNPPSFIGESLLLKDGSIYVPYIMKASGGYGLGDDFVFTLSGKEFKFTIAGFTEEILFGDPMNQRYRLYLTDTDYMNFERTFPERTGFLLSVRLTDKAFADTLYGEYSKDIVITGDPMINYYGVRSVDAARYARTGVTSIIAVVLIAFALILMAVCLIVMRFGIINNIDEGMTNIGALKAFGYRNRQIIFSILLQFGGIAALGGILGVVASELLMPIITSIFESQTAMIWNLGFNVKFTTVTLCFTVFTVMLITFMAVRRIYRLHPLIALRGGFLTHNFKKNTIPLEKTHGALSLLLAVKQLARSKGQSVMIALVIAVVSFAAVIGVSMYSSIGRDTLAFASVAAGEIPDAALLVNNRSDSEDMMKRLRERPEVRKVLGYDNVGVRTGDDMRVMAFIVEDYSQLEGKMLVEGSYPKHDNEIAAGNPFLELTGTKIGDFITIRNGDAEKEYLITGLAQNLSNDGYFLLMTLDGVRSLSTLSGYEFGQIYVYLETDTDVKAFLESVSTDEGDKISNAQDIREQLDATLGYLGGIFAAVAAGTLAVTIIVVVLVLFLVIKTAILRRKREFGIQKAVGFTTIQIMNQIALTYTPIITIAVVLGGICGVLGLNPLFVALTKSMGIVRADFPPQISWTIIVCLALTALAYGVSMLVAWRIRKISAYSLVSE